jgi:hypothetical protein
VNCRSAGPTARSGDFDAGRRRPAIRDANQKLLDVLGKLVDQGNTVLVIEHN